MKNIKQEFVAFDKANWELICKTFNWGDHGINVSYKKIHRFLHILNNPLKVTVEIPNFTLVVPLNLQNETKKVG